MPHEWDTSEGSYIRGTGILEATIEGEPQGHFILQNPQVKFMLSTNQGNIEYNISNNPDFAFVGTQFFRAVLGKDKKVRMKEDWSKVAKGEPVHFGLVGEDDKAVPIKFEGKKLMIEVIGKKGTTNPNATFARVQGVYPVGAMVEEFHPFKSAKSQPAAVRAEDFPDADSEDVPF